MRKVTTDYCMRYHLTNMQHFLPLAWITTEIVTILCSSVTPYLIIAGRIFWTFCSCREHCLHQSRLYYILLIRTDILLIRTVNLIKFIRRSLIWIRVNLSSAWRSTPTLRRADRVERITGPNTATSFRSIFSETLTCLFIFMTCINQRQSLQCKAIKEWTSINIWKIRCTRVARKLH